MCVGRWSHASQESLWTVPATLAQDHAYHLTGERVFPGPSEGIDGVLNHMLKQSGKRIDKAGEARDPAREARRQAIKVRRRINTCRDMLCNM